jgi:putative RNA 2'-phosphotransferase
MDAARRTKVSKYLSKHLRHEPESLGLTLAPGGWVDVDELLAACERNRFSVSRAELEEVVSTSDKQRFSFDPSGTRIRANQGHSTEVDLQLEPATPPDVLYHGTAEKTVPLIQSAGLLKMARHHVHLSPDVPTALKVGSRHGRPFVFAVDAAGMARDGHTFFRSENGVWLVDAVPARYLSPIA